MPSSNTKTEALQKSGQVKIFKELFSSYRHKNYLTSWKRAYVKRIFHDMPPKKNGKFLDIGTGSGFMVIEAAKRGMNAVGLDISPEGVELCKTYARVALSPKDQKNVKFVVGDAENMKLPANSFDRVCSIALLEHLVHDKKVVADIGRLTKKGGIISICVPNTYERTAFFLKILNKRNDKHVGHLRHYKAEDLIAEFRKNSFELIDLTYHGHTCMMVNWIINMIWSEIPPIVDRFWWWIVDLDMRQKEKDNSMNFTITMRKI